MTTNTPKTVYLEPVYSKSKSFNNKATVTTFEDRTILRSYETLVAKLEGGVMTLHNTDKWSSTTVRHVHEFIQQNGYIINETPSIKKSLLSSFHIVEE